MEPPWIDGPAQHVSDDLNRALSAVQTKRDIPDLPVPTVTKTKEELVEMGYSAEPRHDSRLGVCLCGDPLCPDGPRHKPDSYTPDDGEQ